MKSPRPYKALGWDVWRRGRIGMGWVTAGLVAGGLANAWLRGDPQSEQMGEALGYACLALAVLATFGVFQYTEGPKRGGFGRFPARLFAMPVSTGGLVALPMGAGALAVLAVYWVGAWLLFMPLGQSLPKLWPSLYLVGGISIFQTIVWSLPESRYAKLFCLSAAGSVLAFGWMFFLPHVVEGTLQDWGYRGRPEVFMRFLGVVLAFTGPAAYGLSWLRVRQQRRGGVWADLGFRRRSAALLFRNVWSVSSFRRPSTALFWHEWRQTGLILPIAAGVFLVLICVPSYLSQPLSGSATIGGLCWILSAPLLLALILGRGFCKFHFWRPELRMSTYYAAQPTAPGQWVANKLKVAAVSVLVTWMLTLAAAFLWVCLAGEFMGMERWRIWLWYHYSPWKRVLLIPLSVGVLMVFTWRLLLGNLAAGLRGAKGWYYLSNVVCGGTILSLLVWMLRTFALENDAGHLYTVWPWVERLPWILGAAAITKVFLAWRVWWTAYRNELCTGWMLSWYWGSWAGATAWIMAWVVVAISDVMWLRHLLLLSALLAVPLATPGLAVVALHKNRSGSGG